MGTFLKKQNKSVLIPMKTVTGVMNEIIGPGWLRFFPLILSYTKNKKLNPHIHLK